MRYFKNIKDMYPKYDKFGNYFILTKKMERDNGNENFDSEFELSYSGLVEDTTYETNKEFIALLNKNGDLIMSNHNLMLRHYKPYLDSLNGEVLISGLGLGLLLLPLLEDIAVTKIDIIEMDMDIIDYVYINRLKKLDINNKINIINHDIFTFETTNTYDYILLDTWSSPDETSISEANILKLKFTSNLKSGGSIDVPILDFN